MDMHSLPPAIEIHPSQPLRLRVDAGRHITNVSGTSWVTIDGEPDDIILEAGDSHVFARPGRVLVQAMGGDAQLVTEAGVERDRGDTLAAAWHGLVDSLRDTLRRAAGDSGRLA
jgi:hypothetical protein